MSSEEFGPKDWIRCNNCYILMRNSKVPFFLSSCSHIFCNKCVKIVLKKCPRCHSQNIRTMPLTEPLNPAVEHCFESIEKLTEKLTQASTFQSHQMEINCSRFSSLDKKYIYAKTECQRKIDHAKMLQNRVRELENALELSQRKMYQFESNQRQMRDLQNSSAMLTPQTVSGSGRSTRSFSHSSGEDRSYGRKKFHDTPLTPTKLEEMDLNSEFRIPSMTKVPRSVGSSSKSWNSSIGTPFTKFTPINNRR